MTKCPHCGSEEYYVKTRIYGKCDHYRRFDGKETDNSGMHDNLTYVDGTIAYCAECKKRLFRLEEEC
ncbi:hypothetical protein CBF29_07860 [Vagococcus elongatus]|uniref:Uncharacterized protein n=2 Tax=Vagococcus elongatus TaxID=180344 RepID=A0A430AU95_9ENTE|nr:hypothetical protein CBF29_07860 [Vagococcus elongatus]